MPLIWEGDKGTALRTPVSPTYGAPMTEQGGLDRKDAKLQPHRR